MSRVVVTGIGLATPLGLGREKSWQALVRSESGVTRDGDGILARIGDLVMPEETRLLSMAFLSAAEAIQDSGLDCRLVLPGRFGCSVSVSKPNLSFLRSPGQGNFLDAFLPSALGGQLARIFAFRGPVRNIKAACATGTDSVIVAAEWIRRGVCDAALAGAAESSLHPLYRAAFRQMGVLAGERVAPFDRRREGFAMGEGAGILVLERKDRALMRGARVYGEIAGGATANDAHHPVAFDADGEAIARTIGKVLGGAGLDTVDYLNAHGTATLLNDLIETRAIKKAFGNKAAGISVSSTKAATGHLLGASGAVELAFAFLAMRDALVPPTLNLTDPDPECDLDYTPLRARPRRIDTALSLSFGFGGQIGVVACTR